MVDTASQTALGVTPVVVERPRASAPLTVRIDKRGYTAATEVLAFDGDRAETVTLLAASVPTQATVAGTGTSTSTSAGTDATPAHGKDKTKHHGTHVGHARPDDEPAKL